MQNTRLKSYLKGAAASEKQRDLATYSVCMCVCVYMWKSECSKEQVVNENIFLALVFQLQ